MKLNRKNSNARLNNVTMYLSETEQAILDGAQMTTDIVNQQASNIPAPAPSSPSGPPDINLLEGVGILALYGLVEFFNMLCPN